jgi:hypothetical protein
LYSHTLWSGAALLKPQAPADSAMTASVAIANFCFMATSGQRLTDERDRGNINALRGLH